MDWELAMRRQAVMGCRDQQILAARALFNSKALDALNAFEEQLAEASLLDSIWDPASFANARIDALMHEALAIPLKVFLEAGAKELVTLDRRLAKLGEALSRPEAITLPMAQEQEIPPPAEMKLKANTPPEVVADKRDEGWRLTRLPGKVAEGAASIARYASETTEWLLQDKAGLRNRLRTAAGERIARQWMGDIGEPRPVLSQVIIIIDEVTHEARTSLL